MTESAYSGSCYCGAIGYTVSKDASVRMAGYCHCNSCRVAHASPIYHVVYVAPEDVVFTRGEDKLRKFTKEGSHVCRAFCSCCGSRMANWLHHRPDYLGFFPATLDESVQQNLPDIFKASMHFNKTEAVLDLDALCLFELPAEAEEEAAAAAAVDSSSANGRELCPNTQCKCPDCTCGLGCTCGVSTEVVCDPCVDFKKAAAAHQNNAK
jgi:hypothetical protein